MSTLTDEEIRLTQEMNKAKKNCRALRAACESAYAAYYDELQFRANRGQQVSPMMIKAVEILRETLKQPEP